MVEPRGRILDDLVRLVTDAAGVAQGVRREAETLARSQLDRLIATMDLVSREEFEAVRDMAALARDENDALRKRIEALEAKLALQTAGSGDPLRS
jgi:BMFP domain-containing protein YqiC